MLDELCGYNTTKAYPLEYSGGEPVGLGSHSDAGFPTERPLTGRKWGDRRINCIEVDSPYTTYLPEQSAYTPKGSAKAQAILREQGARRPRWVAYG